MLANSISEGIEQDKLLKELKYLIEMPSSQEFTYFTVTVRHGAYSDSVVRSVMTASIAISGIEVSTKPLLYSALNSESDNEFRAALIRFVTETRELLISKGVHI